MVVYFFLFLSVLGFLDSAFLSIQHYNRDPFSCPLFGGCEQVTSSIYSEVFGIPIALLGAAYYTLIFISSLYSYLAENKRILFLVSHLTIFGFTASAYLVYIMLFVLNAVCFYCIISAAISTLLFITFVVNWHPWKSSPKGTAKS
jgi:uncharacterized membrane protein